MMADGSHGDSEASLWGSRPPQMPSPGLSPGLEEELDFEVPQPPGYLLGGPVGTSL
jgi:hypothetical protein